MTNAQLNNLLNNNASKIAQRRAMLQAGLSTTQSINEVNLELADEVWGNPQMMEDLEDEQAINELTAALGL